MKTYPKLKLLCAAFLALFSFSSCLDTDDPAFGISGISYYVYQETTRTGGPVGDEGDAAYTYRYYFQPIIQIATNDIASNVTCNGPTGPISLSAVDGYANLLWETRFSSALMSGTVPAGTYTIQATNADAETASYQFTIPDMEPLGYIEITEAPTCVDGRISVKWAQVDNADSYAVYILDRSEELNPRYSSRTITASGYKGEGIEFTISASEMENYGLESGTQYNICVVAVGKSSSTSSLSGGVGLVSYSDKTMITL